MTQAKAVPRSPTPSELVLFGRVHRADRVRGGYILACCGRFVWRSRVLVVTESDPIGRSSARCKRCFG